MRLVSLCLVAYYHNNKMCFLIKRDEVSEPSEMKPNLIDQTCELLK